MDGRVLDGLGKESYLAVHVGMQLVALSMQANKGKPIAVFSATHNLES